MGRVTTRFLRDKGASAEADRQIERDRQGIGKNSREVIERGTMRLRGRLSFKVRQREIEREEGERGRRR